MTKVVKDWNLGSKPASPPSREWTPVKQFIKYEYPTKTLAGSALSQNPVRQTGAKPALKKLVGSTAKQKR